MSWCPWNRGPEKNVDKCGDVSGIEECGIEETENKKEELKRDVQREDDAGRQIPILLFLM